MDALAKLRAISTQFWPAKPSVTEVNIALDACVGKVFLITGGNAGPGYELCKMLFRSGATIYMATRSQICSHFDGEGSLTDFFSGKGRKGDSVYSRFTPGHREFGSIEVLVAGLTA
ncbi:hypothetical protein GGR57DRAFT_198812 [Xylariaceae sp. FL1272]|nr:hypothetical protein GGR57DRAFT_198812 [Xylariaceae sp. FL1272]